MQSLKDKIEWALASSISAPAGSKSRMIPAKGIPKLERELQVKRVLEAFSAELDKIQIEIGQLDHHNILDKVDKIIDKARKELGE